MSRKLADVPEIPAPGRIGAPGPERAAQWLTSRWLLLANLVLGMYVGGTLLAPVLMHLGMDGPAGLVYALYSLACHQLPERSYFLFGPHVVDTYPKAQVIAWGADPAHLGRFVGNAQVGFKLAIAERDIAIYVTLFLAGLIYALVRRRVRGLPWIVYGLLILPMALDGGSHLVSEVTQLGFRESNTWLAVLTGNAFAQAFYSGTTSGSFNWWMRTLTGALFAVSSVWFAYPYLDRAFVDTIARLPAITSSHDAHHDETGSRSCRAT